jgi:hypothetical protein
MPGTCEKPLPQKDMGGGHIIACHLPEETLNAMEPVIQIEDTAAE